MKHLVSLDEWNDRRDKPEDGHDQSKFNGIACPKCGAELLDCDNSRVKLMNPPLVQVWCVSCGFSGHRRI